MRVVHILNHCDHGHGNAHVAVDLACVQAENGYHAIYASGGGDYSELLDHSGVQLERIDQQTLNPLKLSMSLFKLVKLCHKIKPDILHAHMMMGAAIGFVASRITGIPLVTTVHNSFDSHSVLMRLGHRVVAVSEAEKRSLAKRGFRESSVDVVINGPNQSPRERWSEDEEIPVHRPCVTTVCGLHRRKGVADLLKGFQEATEKRQDWHLNIVGAGADRQALEALTDSLMLQKRVTFFGSVAKPKSILARSDIFVLASYADPCSLAVAEARYAGCAIIATAVGGTPELLGNGQHGILVEPGHPEQIAAALQRMMASNEELKLWRDRSLINSEFLTIERVVRDYDAVYRRAMERQSACVHGGLLRLWVSKLSRMTASLPYRFKDQVPRASSKNIRCRESVEQHGADADGRPNEQL